MPRVKAAEVAKPDVLRVLATGERRRTGATLKALKGALNHSATVIAGALKLLEADGHAVMRKEDCPCCGYVVENWYEVVRVQDDRPEPEGTTAQGEFFTDDPRLDRNGSKAHSEWKQALKAMLALWGREPDRTLRDDLDEFLTDTPRRLARAQAGVLKDSWPAFQFINGERNWYIVPVAAAEVNNKPNSEWRKARDAFELNRALAEVTGRPVLLAFADGRCADVRELEEGRDYIVTGRGQTEHIAIKRGTMWPTLEEVLL